MYFFFFFFSSRRRHTRFDCDWSSDVCSSDLAIGAWCGIPLVLLVIGVGEPPRNYIAEIGIVIALASCGWTWLAGRVAARSPSIDGAAIDPRLGSVGRVLLSTLTGAALGFAVAFATRVVTIRLATVAGAATGAVI